MKKLLLLTSLACICCSFVFGQEKVKSKTAVSHTDAAKAPVRKTKHKVRKKKHTAIVHTGPNQNKIDSLKNEKIKSKH